MERAPRVDPLEQPVFELLAATESLWTSLSESPSPEDWALLLERRNAAFSALERAAAGPSDARPPVTAAARTCLERIAELDGAILRAGAEGLGRLQRERLALGNRRRAVLAHGAQEREAPRAITVKA